ncbi:regulatory protein recx [Fagus crenata]
MANLAGNLSFRISSQLQYRVFFIPWVKKNYATAITCLQSRDYSSSAPVRYTPKKYCKVNNPESPLPIKDSEKNEFRYHSDAIQRSIVFNKEKSENHNQMFQNNVLFDDDEQDYELMEEPEKVIEKSSICKGKDSEQDVSCDVKTKQDAENLAIKLLATRAFTAVEMRKRLYGKKFSPDTVEAVINDFRRRGYINDSLYAETFSRSRWSNSSWGPIRIKRELWRKGVSKVDAENAVKLVFEQGESGDHESSLGLSKPSMDHLFIQASKQWLRGQDVPKEKRKSRIIHWLQYRGFNWGVISIILKKLESQYSP